MALLPLRLARQSLVWVAAATLACPQLALAARPENVLVVVNRRSEISRQAGAYYMSKRKIPRPNLCEIDTAPVERIQRKVYEQAVEAPIAACLKSRGLVEQTLFILTTHGVPLVVDGTKGMAGDNASVDSELTMLYAKLRGRNTPLNGPFANPFFMQTDAPFEHARFPMYLVTRLAGYGIADIRALVDRGSLAKNRGKVYLDLRAEGAGDGDAWMRRAALLLPRGRAVMEETTQPLYDQKDAIGFASWGSNDKARKRRRVGFQWLPGAIMTEYVSTNGRTFEKPPEDWTIGSWSDNRTFFARSPQTLTADYIAEGVTGASGHTDEPFLTFTPRPEFLFPAYLSGRTLAESYWMSIPAVSWQNIVVGDPLTVLAPQ